MSWFNQQLAKVFPAFALKRAIAMRRLKMLEGFGKRGLGKTSGQTFDAIKGGRGRYDILSTSRSPDEAIRYDIQALREHVRQSEYNEGFVRGPIRRIVRESVGRGIRYQARLKADTNNYQFPKITPDFAKNWNFMAEKGWKIWNKQADKRLISTFYELQALAEAALIRDGEVLAIGRKSLRRGRIIPYCLELVEADRMATPTEEITNPRVRNGIRYDVEGVPEAYFLYKHHPGEGYMIGMRSQDFDEVPAYFGNGGKKVLHLFNPIRPEQSRGFSEFGPGLKDLQDLERYMEAEKMAALEAACLTGIVKTENPTGFQQAFTDPSGSSDYDRIHDFSPGAIHYMRPGEDFDIKNPQRPNDAFGPFIDQLLRGPANALDIPPEIFSQNWGDLNYNAGRTITLQFYAAMIMRQFYLVNHLCQPVLENVISWLVVKGAVASEGFDRRQNDFFEAAWIPSVYRKWVDPIKEAKGQELGLKNLTGSLTDTLAEQGKDFEEHIDQIVMEKVLIKEKEKAAGITLSEPKKEPTTFAPGEGQEGDKGDKSLKVVKIK